MFAVYAVRPVELEALALSEEEEERLTYGAADARADALDERRRVIGPGPPPWSDIFGRVEI